MYSEVPPPDRLAPLVECFWTIRSDGPLTTSRLNRVLPDGCSDIIFNFGDPPAGRGAAYHRLHAFVVGTMRTAVNVWLKGSVDLLGIRFRPGGALAVTAVPANELTDRVVPLEEVLPTAGAIESRLADIGVTERLAVLTGLIEGRLSRARMEPDPRVRHAAGLIERHDGRVSVEAIARDVNLSRRQLERLFHRTVGSTPKEACRVARFRAAVRRMHRERTLSLSRLAHATGFHDQSHMAREFRRLGGITPAGYLEEISGRSNAVSGVPSALA